MYESDSGRTGVVMKSVKTLFGLTVFTLTALLLSGCFKTQAVSPKTETADVSAGNTSQFTLPPKEVPSQPTSFATKTLTEYVIYTCQVGSEEIPAVHIAEIQDVNNGRVSGISVHVTSPEKIDLLIKGGKAVWDYKAVSAQHGVNSVQVVYDPQAESPEYDWVLSIKGKDTHFKTRVRDCMEVSAE